MKVGDLVKWIGFPGACLEGVKNTGPLCKTGIIINMYRKPYKGIRGPLKVDVAWGDGSFSTNLYPETIKVINENR